MPPVQPSAIEPRFDLTAATLAAFAVVASIGGAATLWVSLAELGWI